MSAPSADPTNTTHIALTKAGKLKIRYPAELLSDDGTHLVVRAAWARDTVKDFGFVRFEPGDVFVEHYWRDRWYAVKEVRSPDNTLKGWYCDVARPAVVHADGTVEVEDLDLDLWRSADGTDVLRLDEDEFAESGLAARDPQAAAEASRTLDTLERAARTPEFTDLLAVH
ncbi:hypothetical protein GCM10010329_70240 [Streptomyces spiroverticillatus]|uniref:DUF402 domain-containing protein n=1 Tax=Streptomyces finlayi TaxID=67296 RepID=A0A918X0P4_9ACTN|nr:DUF402 domain-containing protein [Streptomyces finlayi]GHA37023.1 hypothetical protein GCM10010329_70240 [Streptomyces spiroverticillatus]GHD01652.1 hypothetical protein GCM10010334_47560 [Streptomyces finlayi]